MGLKVLKLSQSFKGHRVSNDAKLERFQGMWGLQGHQRSKVFSQGSMVKELHSFFQKSSQFQGLSKHLWALKDYVKAFKFSGSKGFKGPNFTVTDQSASKFSRVFKGFKFSRASRAKGSHLGVSTLVHTPMYRLLLVAM